MPSKAHLEAIQQMHETKTVTRDALIGWYGWYQSQLPPLKPVRSDTDLLLTLATWMDLTEEGGQPAFPYEYRTDLDFSTVDFDIADRPSLAWPLGALMVIGGLIILFFYLWMGLSLIAGGLLLHWLLYRSRGAATAVAMKDERVRRQVDRALEWVLTHHRGPLVSRQGYPTATMEDVPLRREVAARRPARIPAPGSCSECGEPIEKAELVQLRNGRRYHRGCIAISPERALDT